VFGDERLVAVAVPPTRLPSGSVTFLLTDVVGSTRIWEDAPEVMPGALERHDRLLQAAVESSTVDSATALYLGMLASLLDAPEAADRHFATALELHQAMSAPFPTARSELEWGKLLLRDGPTADPERARDLLESAHSAAVLHGYAEIARQAANLLGRAPS